MADSAYPAGWQTRVALLVMALIMYAGVRDNPKMFIIIIIKRVVIQQFRCMQPACVPRLTYSKYYIIQWEYHLARAASADDTEIGQVEI